MGESQQETQSTYDAESEKRTLTTLVGGEWPTTGLRSFLLIFDSEDRKLWNSIVEGAEIKGANVVVSFLV